MKHELSTVASQGNGKMLLVLTTAKAYHRRPWTPHSIWARYSSCEGLLSLCSLTYMLHNLILATVWQNCRCQKTVSSCLKGEYNAGRGIRRYAALAIIECKEKGTILANSTGKKCLKVRWLGLQPGFRIPSELPSLFEVF